MLHNFNVKLVCTLPVQEINHVVDLLDRFNIKDHF